MPTRNRPEGMKRLVDSAFRMAQFPFSIEIIFYLDHDDVRGQEMFQELKNDNIEYYRLNDNIRAVVGDRIILSQMWNECYKITRGDICQHSGDDIVFRTENWDTIVLREFAKVPDKILFLYGRDGIIDSEKLGTHGFIHRNWVETVGYFVPPYFSFWYNDTWLTEVATKIGRKKYIPELYTEHLHYTAGKAEIDATYQDALDRGKVDDVTKIYKSKTGERQENVNKLLRFINNYQGKNE